MLKRRPTGPRPRSQTPTAASRGAAAAGAPAATRETFPPRRAPERTPPGAAAPASSKLGIRALPDAGLLARASPGPRLLGASGRRVSTQLPSSAGEGPELWRRPPPSEARPSGTDASPPGPAPSGPQPASSSEPAQPSATTRPGPSSTRSKREILSRIPRKSAKLGRPAETTGGGGSRSRRNASAPRKTEERRTRSARARDPSTPRGAPSSGEGRARPALRSRGRSARLCPPPPPPRHPRREAQNDRGKEEQGSTRTRRTHWIRGARKNLRPAVSPPSRSAHSHAQRSAPRLDLGPTGPLVRTHLPTRTSLRRP